MNRIQNLHNKTRVLEDNELPYNSNNKLINLEDLRKLFDEHGLENVPIYNLNLYRNAFIHRSYCTMKNTDFESGNERCPDNCIPLQEMSYERLEFIGDSILGMVCATYLHERYPDQSEGFLSKLRTKLVNGKMLGSLASKMGLDKFALISKQIENVQGRNNYKIMEDIFEALIGAIYIDYNNIDPEYNKLQKIIPMSGAGYHVAETWIISIFEKYLDFAELIKIKTNYKDMLVQFMQHTYQDAPKFYEISIEVENNQKIFTYCVKNKTDFVLGTSKGKSKREAENLSAKEALKYYGQSIP